MRRSSVFLYVHTVCALPPLILVHFQVPIEVERLMDNDLVLEQYLLPSSPLLAGFRLDAFNAIKPRITHSPSSDVDIWDTSITFLEDRHISPAVLYIQVSALQVSVRLAFMILIVNFNQGNYGGGNTMRRQHNKMCTKKLSWETH